MKKSQFDEFINLYDGKTKGKYTYYYKYLWNACHNAEVCYEKKHKAPLWGHMKDKGEWVRDFKAYLNTQDIPEELAQSVSRELVEWIEVVR